MERKLVTCPESAHLEEIEFEQTPCGMVITACSRYSGDVRCARECAARLDRRARASEPPINEDTSTRKSTLP